MKLVVVGINHRTASVALRERFAVPDPAPWLEKLRQSGEVEEAVLISTCNRVEVVAMAEHLEAATFRLTRFFLQELGAGIEPAPSSEVLYKHSGRDAVRHLFRVASSLDSMVVGEPQILGQVKDAYRTAGEEGASGPILNRLFSNAFGVAKQVRTQTEIAKHTVSVARVGVDLARQIFEDLDGKRALLIGAGEMIELALEALRGAGLAEVRVANRSVARAQALAGRFNASAHALEELEGLLTDTDIVLTSLGVESAIFGTDLFGAALQRRREPMFAIDLGVPRNIVADVGALDGLYLYDLDDLSEIAREGVAGREREARRAEVLVDEAVERFVGWLLALRAVPTIKELRERADGVRRAEVEKALRKLDVDDATRSAIEALSNAIVNKVLHPPVSILRAVSGREEGLAMLESARELFALDAPEEDDDGADEDGR